MKTTLAGLVFVLTLLLVFAAFQVVPYLAYRRTQDLNWLNHASPSEIRDTTHSALTYVLGDPHDSFGLVQTYGDRSSIPYLRFALARQPASEIKSGEMECTWIHGRLALERVLKLPK